MRLFRPSQCSEVAQFQRVRLLCVLCASAVNGRGLALVPFVPRPHYSPITPLTTHCFLIDTAAIRNVRKFMKTNEGGTF